MSVATHPSTHSTTMSRPLMTRIAGPSTYALGSTACTASSSRTYASRSKGTAAKPAKNPAFGQPPTTPTDQRSEALRLALYPPNAHLPKSHSPTGAHQHDALQRLQTLIPHPEIHETIERAWYLYRRHERQAHAITLRERYKAMTEACKELDQLTMPKTATDEKKGPATYDRQIYVQAMSIPNFHAQPRLTGRGISAEKRWRETRYDGLFPREAWIPTETKGKGWNYTWHIPS